MANRIIRVLLIEDDEDDYIITRDLLAEAQREKFALDWVSSYQEAIDAIKRCRYDVFLLDYRLGEHTGLELLGLLARQGCQAPIIMLTGQSEDEIDLAAMKAGAADYLVKGQLTPTLLERSIRYSIERMHSLEALREAREKLEQRVAERTAELSRLVEERARLLESEQAARREAEEANRLKDEFLATVSHELRTPLTAIGGWLRLLRSGRLNEQESAQAMETIDRNVQVQTQLVNDLLDISRIITGKLFIKTKPVKLAPIVESVVKSFRPAANSKSIEIHLELAPESAPIIGDTTRLEQIVWNIISNALKFTPPGGRIDVRLSSEDRRTKLIVSDTGKGIDREFLPYVFDRCRQADSTMTRVHGGLGIGLAIVRHLVELHGGEVYAESGGAGQGATFTLILPAQGKQQSSHEVEQVA